MRHWSICSFYFSYDADIEAHQFEHHLEEVDFRPNNDADAKAWIEGEIHKFLNTFKDINS